MCALPMWLIQQNKNHLLAVHKVQPERAALVSTPIHNARHMHWARGWLTFVFLAKGGKLSLPFVYSDEVWTGIEHQVAAHLMLMGQVKEGLDMVRASRNRYDGKIRNPSTNMNAAIGMQGRFPVMVICGPTGLRYDLRLTRHCLLIRVSGDLLPLSQRRRTLVPPLKSRKGICKTAYGKN